jgi:hypothetical protein
LPAAFSWRDWIEGKEKPKYPNAAFVAFCRKKYQGRNALKEMALQERRSPQDNRALTKQCPENSKP